MIQIVAKIFVCPDILAYRDSDFLPKQLDWLLIICRLEVPGLVEHVVGGQEGFGDLSDRPASFEHRTAVDKRFPGFFRIEIHVTDEQRNRADLPVQYPQLFESLGNKSGFEDEVLRRIAG